MKKQLQNKMKQLSKVIALGLVFTSTCSVLKAQSWDWAKQAGALGNESGSQIVVDKNGNSYITGSFNGDTAKFGSILLLNTAAPGTGTSDAFVAKYDPNGNVLWAKKGGSSKGNDGGGSIGIDSLGNVYIIGGCVDSIKFGANLIVHATYGTFIAKYDNNGNEIWAKDVNIYRTRDMNVDPSGNCYIVWQNGIQKLDNNAAIVWQKTVPGNTYLTDIRIDAQRNSYVMGTTPSAFTMNAANVTVGDFFLKMDPSGNGILGKTYSATQNSQNNSAATSIEVDQSGNIIVASTFMNSIVIEGNTITSNGSIDFFIVKYDAAATFQWVKNDGGTSVESLNFLRADANGDIYTGGSTPAAFNFDTLSTQVQSAYIVKLNAGGSPLWQISSTCSPSYYNANAASIDIGLGGDVYVTGGFQGSMAMGATTLVSAQEAMFIFKSDVYIGKLNPASLNGINSFGSAEFNISVYPNPNDGKFNLQIPAGKRNVTVQIANSLGEIVYSKIATEVNNTIDLNNGSSGLYTIKVIEANKISTSKFIKQ